MARAFSLIRLTLLFALVLAPVLTVFAQGPQGILSVDRRLTSQIPALQAAEEAGIDPDQNLTIDSALMRAFPWLDRKEFVDCGMACLYRKSIEMFSQIAFFMTERRQRIEDVLRDDGKDDSDKIAAIRNNLRDYCTARELQSDQLSVVRGCFERFEVLGAKELRTLNGLMVRMKDAVIRLEGGASGPTLATTFSDGRSPEERAQLVDQASYFPGLLDLQEIFERHALSPGRSGQLLRTDYDRWVDGIETWTNNLPRQVPTDEYAVFKKETLDSGRTIWVPETVVQNGQEVHVVDMDAYNRDRTQFTQDLKKSVEELRQIAEENGRLQQNYQALSQLEFDEDTLGQETVDAARLVRDALVSRANEGRPATGRFYRGNASSDQKDRTPSSQAQTNGAQAQSRRFAMGPGVNVLDFQLPSNTRTQSAPAGTGRSRIHLPNPGEPGVYTEVRPNEIPRAIEVFQGVPQGS